jgi:hypothetical protein
MSKNNNVNPGQYTDAGRERQGEDVIQEREKMKEGVGAHEEREQASDPGGQPRSKPPQA